MIRATRTASVLEGIRYLGEWGLREMGNGRKPTR